MSWDVLAAKSVVLVMGGVAAVTPTATTPGLDLTVVLVAAIAAMPPSLIAFFGYKASQAAAVAAREAAKEASEAKVEAAEAKAVAVATGITVDGVKTELVKAVRGQAMAEGLTAGRIEGKATEKAHAAEVKEALDTPLAAAVANGGVPVEVVIAGQSDTVEVTETPKKAKGEPK